MPLEGQRFGNKAEIQCLNIKNDVQTDGYSDVYSF